MINKRIYNLKNNSVKYRAWNEELKRMFFFEHGKPSPWFWQDARNHNHVLMRSLGKKDVNGNDIYEGDILVRCKYPFYNNILNSDEIKGNVFEIEFENGK